MKLSKTLCVLQIGAQLFYSSLCVYSFSFNAAANTTVPHQNKTLSARTAVQPDTNEQSSDAGGDIAGIATQAGNLLQSDALKSNLVSGATGMASQSVEDWLNQFGTARVSVSADENLSLEQLELDVLLALYDDKTNLLFTQLGGRRADDRNIINTGVGYRHFSDKWMWGANTFYDRQISENHHQRAGFGGELGWDYLKISANGYLRLSDWMASSRYENYDERAANGFDIRTEGYLPSYPQLGASAVFEKFFGENVDLFNDEDNRQKDPYAVTLGLSYTPFTLMTGGISQKMGKGDTQDTQFTLSFSYAPSVSLDKQLDPAQVALRRSLVGGRQDLVNRNNTIVLDYRKQDVISLGLPDKIEGVENITLPVNVVINSKNGVDRIDWQAGDLIRQGGEIVQDKRSGQYSLTLPHYQFGNGTNHYVVSGKAFDTRGNGSNLSQMNVYVTGSDASTWQATTSVSPSSLLADGSSTSTVTVKILGSGSQAVSGIASQLSAAINFTATLPAGAAQDSVAVQKPGISAFKETSPGIYTGTFTSGNVAGTADITPMVNGRTVLPSARITLHSADTTASLSTISASKTRALANGTDNIELTVKVLNVEGLPYKGVNVTWGADHTEAQLSATQSVTGENGLAVINVSSLNVLNTTVSVSLETGSTLSSGVLSFSADTATAQVTSISTDKGQAVANNSDKVTLTATVLNAQEQPVNGAPVDWKIEQGNGILSAAQSATDAKGNAQMTLTSAVANSVVVSARTGTTEAKNADTIVFIADDATMNITGFTVDKTQALANGTDAVSYVVTVTDAGGNKVANAPVSFSSDSAVAKLSATTVNTDAQGQATLRLTSTVAGDVIVSAKLLVSSASQAPAVTFTADAGTAQLSDVTADKAQALANGTDLITLKTTLTDINGNPLTNTDVNWHTSPAGGILSGISSKTDAQGIAVVTLASSAISEYVVTASDSGASAVSPTLTFVADSSTAVISSLMADKTSGVVAGVDSVKMQAVVLDASGHPVPDVTVSWRSDNGTGQFTPASGTTDINGVATAQFTETRAQTTVITASIASGSKTLSIDVIADAATTQFISVDANKTQALADGNDRITLSTTLKDCNGNPLSNTEVSWSLTPATGMLSSGSTKTDASGLATVTLSSSEVENFTVTAQANGVSKTSPSLAFTADAATAHLVTLTADKTAGMVAGKDTVTLTATVLDDNNHPVQGATVSWRSDNGTGQFTPVSGVTDINGVATAQFTETRAQTTVITASIASGSKTLSIDVIADAATTQFISVDANKTQALADGNDRITLSTTLADSNGNPLSNTEVSWSLTPATGMLSSGSTKTDASGLATVTLSSSEVENFTVTAQANGVSKTSPSLAFTADAATAHLVTLTADKTAGVVAGKDTVTLTATVLDDNNHPVQGATVSWSSDSASGQFTPVSGVTDISGVATAEFTETKAQMTVVTATTAANSKTQSIEMIADVSTARLTDVTTDKVQALADGKEAITWRTMVKDANGNPVTNATVKWSSDNANITPATGSTNTGTDGTATVTATSVKAGDAIMTAALTSPAGSVSAGKVRYIADASTPKLTAVVADKTQALANGADLITLSATVTDINSNPLVNADVAWSTNPANGTLSASSTKTDAQGQATVTLSSLALGNYTVTASASGATATSPSLTFIADVTTAQIATLTADKTVGIVAGIDSVALQATVQDASQHPVPGATVSWSSDNASGTFTPVSGVTDANGIASATLTSTLAQTTVIKAATTNSEKTLSAELVANHETAQITIAADKVQATANGADVVTWKATVLDANNNPVKGQSVDWKNDSATVTLAGSNSQTEADGTALMTGTSLKSGTAIVTATLTEQQRSASAEVVTFIGDLNTAQILTLTANKKTAYATGKDIVTYTAQVKDINDNVITGIPLSWATNMNNLSAKTSVMDGDGIAVINLSGINDGSVEVTASIGSASRINDEVHFISKYDGEWIIGNTTSQYMTPWLDAASDSGFLVVEPTGGPSSLETAKYGVTPLTAPMEDASGNKVTVNFGGQRVTACTARTFNSSVGCQGGARIYAKLSYSAANNPDLPAGVYTGYVKFVATNAKHNPAINYTVHVVLTVQ